MTLASVQGYRGLLSIYLKPQWPRVVLLIFLLLSSIGLELANPQLLRLFIDTAMARGSMQTMVYIALLFLGVAVLGQLAAIAETYVAENVELTATNQLRADLTLHCLRLDPSFHTAHTPGELIERVDGDVSKLGNFFSRFVVALLGSALLLLGVLVILFRVDWRVGAALTGFVLVSLAIVNRLRGIATPHWQAERQASADLFGFLEERFCGTEDLRSCGATAYAMRSLYEHSRLLLRKRRKAAQMGVTTWMTMMFLFSVGTAIGLALGVCLYQEGTITIGIVYLIFGYTALIGYPIQRIVRQIEDLQQATASITRIRALLATRSLIEEGTRGEGKEVPAAALSVEFQDVSFQYVDDVAVLKHISLSLKPGTVLGLLGRTGSGKTTLTKLLVRLYDPTAGDILLGGIDLRAIRLHDLRQHVGMVSQDIQLFHTTVRTAAHCAFCHTYDLRTVAWNAGRRQYAQQTHSTIWAGEPGGD